MIRLLPALQARASNPMAFSALLLVIKVAIKTQEGLAWLPTHLGVDVAAEEGIAVDPTRTTGVIGAVRSPVFRFVPAP